MPQRSNCPAEPPATATLELWSAWRLLGHADLRAPMLVLALGLLGLVMALIWADGQTGVGIFALSWPGFLLLSLGGLILAVWRLIHHLLRPLAQLERTVIRVCQGEPGASLALREMARQGGILANLAQAIDGINEELADLYEDMDNRIARQTMRLAQKTASIKILYDVAAGINESESLDTLLLHFLHVLKEMINGRAAVARLVMSDGSRRLIGAIGLDEDRLTDPELAQMDFCMCNNVLAKGEMACDPSQRYCSRIYGRGIFRGDEIEVVTVPLEHRDELLGYYTIFVNKPGISGREDILELLFSIGHHLGIAVAKHRSDEHARRLSIMEERNLLANELHDSLAQTLTSLRLQVNLFHESLAQAGVSGKAKVDLERLRGGLDEAHRELRSLLVSFRAPLDQPGLVPALERITESFRQATGLHVLFQNNTSPLELSAADELQVIRIAQEALANIRKHAQAHTVRVLLASKLDGGQALLVEDDGIGFRLPELDGGKTGEHIGLSVMRERARRIGAELRIESEPEEGTRVELHFCPKDRGQNHYSQRVSIQTPPARATAAAEQAADALTPTPQGCCDGTCH